MDNIVNSIDENNDGSEQSDRIDHFYFFAQEKAKIIGYTCQYDSFIHAINLSDNFS